MDDREALGKFARYFHQDLMLMHSSFEEAANCYLGSVPNAARPQLARALQSLLAGFPGKKVRGLRNAWIRLGAQCAPRGDAMRALVEESLRKVEVPLAVDVDNPSYEDPRVWIWFKKEPAQRG